MNLVSVIMPYCNRAYSLERAMQSVRAQRYRPLQLILVDNGSTDGSRALALAFKEKYESPDFSVISTCCPTQGASCARNRGLEKAEGAYVCFFDSDDEMSDDYISTIAPIARTRKLDAVFSATAMVMPDGSVVARNYGRSMNPAAQILSGMLSTQGIFVSKAFLMRIGGWNEHLPCWNDWELGLRLLLAHPSACWYGKKAFHRIYQHADSITGNSYSRNCDNIVKALRAAQTDLNNSHDHEARCCRRALLYRSAIVAALCRREGNKDCARRLLTTFHKRLPALPALLLYAYTRMGGRGAWRMALLWAQM